MKLKPQATVALSALIVILGILGSAALGWWQTESDKTPQKLDIEIADSGDGVVYDPADIRGSYTLGEISTLFVIPLPELAEAFGVDKARAEGFKVKELETIYTDKDSEVGTSSVRLFVAWYKGLPFERKEDSFLPEKAVLLLREKASLTAEQEAYLDSHTWATAQ